MDSSKTWFITGASSGLGAALPIAAASSTFEQLTPYGSYRAGGFLPESNSWRIGCWLGEGGGDVPPGRPSRSSFTSPNQ